MQRSRQAICSAVRFSELTAEEWEKRDLIVNFKGNSELTTEMCIRDRAHSVYRTAKRREDAMTQTHRSISLIVIHCSATRVTQDFTFEQLEACLLYTSYQPYIAQASSWNTRTTQKRLISVSYTHLVALAC